MQKAITTLFLPLLLTITACSFYIGRDLPIARSIWDECFVGSFVDPGSANLFLSHNRSMITINGVKDTANTAPWDTFVYIGFVHVPDIKGEMTLFFPEVCDPDCRLPSVTAVDGRSGESEVAVNFIILGGAVEGCIPSTDDTLEISFTYVLDGVIHSETIAARRE